MFDFAKNIFRGDRVIWMIFLFLCLISIVEVYSASRMQTFTTQYWQPILKHTKFLVFGAVIILFIHGIPTKYFRVFVIMLPFVWFLLLATLFLGHSVNSANRFLLGFQPSELAKLSLIATTAFFLSRQNNKLSEKLSFYWIWVLSMITCALIFSENLSTAAILYFVVTIMMFIGQVSFKRMALLVTIAFAAVAILFSSIQLFPDSTIALKLKRKGVWTGRIKDYKDQTEVTKNGQIPGNMFQAVAAKIAIARGGIINMPGNSHLSDFLPNASSDFIYAIIIEETGIIGGIFVLALYVFLFIRAGIIAGRCTKMFPKLLVIGCALMIVIQALVNMGVSVGLMPITGQPLPLVSSGGSSILTTCIYVGIILSVSRFENPRGIQQEEAIEEEFEEEKRLANEDNELEVQPEY